MRTANLLADELWRLKVVREREILQLAKLVSTPDIKHIGPSKTELLKTSKGQRQAYHVGLLDVDIVNDTSDIYAKGWTNGFVLLRDLLKQRTGPLVRLLLGPSIHWLPILLEMFMHGDGEM